jgi:hypothetical protein
LYKLVNLLKKKIESCKADTMRLSQNLVYMIAQNTPVLAKKIVPSKSSKLQARLVSNTTETPQALWQMVPDYYVDRRGENLKQRQG